MRDEGERVIAAGIEKWRDSDRGATKNGEVVPLNHGADSRGSNHLPKLETLNAPSPALSFLEEDFSGEVWPPFLMSFDQALPSLSYIFFAFHSPSRFRDRRCWLWLPCRGQELSRPSQSLPESCPVRQAIEPSIQVAESFLTLIDCSNQPIVAVGSILSCQGRHSSQLAGECASRPAWQQQQRRAFWSASALLHP